MQLLALLPALAVASLLRNHIDAEDGSARLASVPVSGTPVAIPSGASEVLELRQPHGGHNVGPAANPGFVSSVSTTQPTTPTTTSKPNLVPVVAVQPVSTTESTDDTTAASITSSSVVVSTSATFGKISSASGSATTSSSSDTKIVIADYTTVRWYESWVGGTYSTWFPTTITVHPAYLTPAPRPGKGEIGMGTLTGELGGTSTIVLGAAPSQAPGWAKGVAAAVGVGIVGMVM